MIRCLCRLKLLHIVEPTCSQTMTDRYSCAWTDVEFFSLSGTTPAISFKNRRRIASYPRLFGSSKLSQYQYVGSPESRSDLVRPYSYLPFRIPVLFAQRTIRYRQSRKTRKFVWRDREQAVCPQGVVATAQTAVNTNRRLSARSAAEPFFRKVQICQCPISM